MQIAEWNGTVKKYDWKSIKVWTKVEDKPQKTESLNDSIVSENQSHNNVVKVCDLPKDTSESIFKEFLASILPPETLS